MYRCLSCRVAVVVRARAVRGEGSGGSASPCPLRRLVMNPPLLNSELRIVNALLMQRLRLQVGTCSSCRLRRETIALSSPATRERPAAERISLSLSLSLYLYVYIYIYMYRERERYIHIHIQIYIYTHIYIYTYTHIRTGHRTRGPAATTSSSGRG